MQTQYVNKAVNVLPDDEVTELISVKMTKAEETGVKQRFVAYMAKGCDALDFFNTFDPKGQVGSKTKYTYEYTGQEVGVYSDIMNGKLPLTLAEQCKIVHSIMIDMASSPADVISADCAFIDNITWIRRAYNSSIGPFKMTYLKCLARSILGEKSTRCVKRGLAVGDPDMLKLYTTLVSAITSVKSDPRNTTLQPEVKGSKKEKRVIRDIGFLREIDKVDGVFSI